MPPIAKSAVVAALAVVAVLACCCLWFAQSALAEDVPANAPQVDFYRVPLMCPAARGLGCGSRAKPILLELEKTSGVAEAWLDHSGETLAVVWATDSSASQRTAILANVSKQHSVRLKELTGETRESSLTSFRAQQGWHRGADVDRLSEQEAEILADRLISRTVNKAPSAKGKMAALRPALTDAIREQLVADVPSIDECRARVMTAARAHLNASELSALASAFDLGYRAIGDEDATGFYCVRSGLTAEQRERKREVGKILRTALIGIRETDQGFEFEYPADLQTYRAVAEFVPLERACCPFFEFGIRLEPAGGRLRVSLTGPEGVKGFIRAEFSDLFER